jgi:hypothetical protein
MSLVRSSIEPDFSGFLTATYHFTVRRSQVLESGAGLIEMRSLASSSSQSLGLKVFCLPPENSGEGRSSKAGLSPITLTCCAEALPAGRTRARAEIEKREMVQSKCFMRFECL